MAKSMNRSRYCAMIVVTLAVLRPSGTCGQESAWSPAKAAEYLDQRAEAWFAYETADRGEGANQTSCVCCHTVVPYAVARPALRKISGTGQPTEFEEKLLAQTQKRVAAWSDVDTPGAGWGLMYPGSAQKKRESWGTEAVLNAVMLSFDDHYQGRSVASDSTRQAFSNLWKVQVRSGDQKGSWEWLDFNLQPWESSDARYYGAALAAIAVGTAPAYYPSATDNELSTHVDLLRGYLQRELADQNLHNRVWVLRASTKLKGILTSDQQNDIIGQILQKQQDDGGWSLSSLGTFIRRDGTPQEAGSDGYATGLVLHTLHAADIPNDDPRLAKGLHWLKMNQTATGQWRGNSVNKKRDPDSHIGKFMSDAATAYAVLALSSWPDGTYGRLGRWAIVRGIVYVPAGGALLPKLANRAIGGWARPVAGAVP